MVNLADLDRVRGMDEQGAELLRKAMAIEPDNADVRHSLGLLLVRQHDYAGALDLLRQASELAPDNARYAYVYAVALNSTGAPGEAMALLERAHQQHPADRDILMALVSIAQRHRGFCRGAVDTRASWPRFIQPTCSFVSWSRISKKKRALRAVPVGAIFCEDRGCQIEPRFRTQAVDLAIMSSSSVWMTRTLKRPVSDEISGAFFALRSWTSTTFPK